MLHTILVPLDGSELAARAVPYASALAGSAGTELVLMRALPLKVSGRPADDRGETPVDLTLDAAVLNAIGVSAKTVVHRIQHLHASDVAEAISTVAEEQHAELIVMSTHGRSGLGRWLYGSTTDTDLHLLHIVEPPSYPLYGDGYAYVPYDADIGLAEARRCLQIEIDRLQAGSKRVTARAVVGQPSSMVARVARDEDVDIVTMATHGRNGLARLVLGSVATATVQRAEVPVLLVRPAAMRHTGAGESNVAPRLGAEAGMPSASPDRPATPTMGLQFSVADLELLGRGLKALAYTPGYDYHLAPRVHVLLDRIDGAVKHLEAVCAH